MFESSQPSPFSRPSSANNNVAKPRLAIGSNYNFPNLAGLSRYLANSRDRCNPGELQLTYRDNRRVSLVVAIEKGISYKISQSIKKKSLNRTEIFLQFNISIMRHHIYVSFRATINFIQYPRFEILKTLYGKRYGKKRNVVSQRSHRISRSSWTFDALTYRILWDRVVWST